MTSKYQIYTDKAGFWRWRYIASNGRIVADSAEAYHNKQDCLWGINLLKTSGPSPITD